MNGENKNIAVHEMEQNQLMHPRSFFPANYTKEEYRKGIQLLEQKMYEFEGAQRTQEEIDKANPLRHSFGDGCYIREIFMPKGEFIVTKIHKVTHPYFFLKGKMSILSEEGEILVEAPHYGITKAGTKRIIYIHSDSIFVTVHVTDETDLAKIEEQIIAKNYGELEEANICHSSV